MHIVAHCPQIPAAAALHHQRLVTTAEQVAEQFVPAIEATRVGAEKPFHAGHQVAPWRLDHRMKMIGHETQGVNLSAGLAARLAQRADKPLPILVIPENRFPPITRFIT